MEWSPMINDPMRSPAAKRGMLRPLSAAPTSSSRMPSQRTNSSVKPNAARLVITPVTNSGDRAGSRDASGTVAANTTAFAAKKKATRPKVAQYRVGRPGQSVLSFGPRKFFGRGNGARCAGSVEAKRYHSIAATARGIAWQRFITETMRSLAHRNGAARVLVATPAGDRHAIGAALVGAAAALEQWNVIYLGTDMPGAPRIDRRGGGWRRRHGARVGAGRAGCAGWRQSGRST